MQKLLVICGPTASGKTDLALRLAEKFEGEIVSADSRQVYKYMDIGTGKDVPEDFWMETSKIHFQGKKVPYYTNGKTRIWGYDLVHPREEFSVAQYTDVAHAIISHIQKEGKLPIVVGGTGLYIRSVVDGIGTAAVPKDDLLREKLERFSVEDLQRELKGLDPGRYEAMNFSDRKNPRRLIRAIEIVSFGGSLVVPESPKYEVLMIGLKVEKDVRDERINLRVEKRMREGMRDEITSLLEKGVKWNMQSMSSIGYKQWYKYFKGEEAFSDVSRNWKLAERKYAKRQMTWFKKDERVQWFSATDENYVKKIVKLVQTWHNRV